MLKSFSASLPSASKPHGSRPTDRRPAKHFRFKRNRLRHAVQRQVAGNIQLVAILLHAGRDKCRLREFADVKEVGAAQVLVALGVVSVDAAGVNGDIHLIRGRIFLIKGKAAVEIFKSAVEPAVAKVLDAELNKGMLPLFIDFIVRGSRRLGCKQQRCCGQTAKRFSTYYFSVSIDEAMRQPSIRFSVISRSIKWCFSAAGAVQQRQDHHAPCQPEMDIARQIDLHGVGVDRGRRREQAKDLYWLAFSGRDQVAGDKIANSSR